MELQQLRAFLAVARGGGYAKAAEAVYRTQPAVTAAVKALERELGIALFERRGRRAALTPAGTALVAEAGPALAQWEGLPDRIRERLSGEAQGVLRIGAGEAAVLYLLPSLLARFQKRHPMVRIILHHQRADQTLGMLKAGELDLGVRSLTVVPAWAVYRPSRSYPRVAVCARGHVFAGGGLYNWGNWPGTLCFFPGRNPSPGCWWRRRSTGRGWPTRWVWRPADGRPLKPTRRRALAWPWCRTCA